MLLKNQIRNEVEIPLYDHELKGIEKIADEFAIGFINWCKVKYILSSLDYHLTTKQLLEIYKKEKNL